MSVDFSQYKIKDETPEVSESSSFSMKDIPRHLARSGARIGETLAGLPADIAEMGAKPLNWIAKQTKEHLGFGKPKTEEELSKISNKLPTSRKIREFGRKATKGYLEPTTEAEQIADDYLQLATSLAIPGPKAVGAGKVLQGLKKAGSLSGLATGTKYGLKAFGVDDATANVASFAALAIPGLLKGRNPRETVNQLYKEANSLLPHGAKISSEKIVPSMQGMLKILGKGTKTPSKSAAIRTAEDIIEKSRSGMIDIEELTSFKRDINELMKDPELLRRSEKFLPKISHEVDELLENYGKQHPEWLQKYRLANHMFGGLERSKEASNFLGKYEKFIKNPTTLLVLGLTPHVGISKVATGLAIQKGYEILHRIFTNKGLRSFYKNIVKEAGKENTKAIPHLLRQFDSKMDKEFPDFEQYRVKEG